jgi:6-phosphofructokinase 1
MAQFDFKKLKRIGVYCSGGDAPGMNAAVRAVVRTAIYKNLEVVGIENGYTGFLKESFVPLQLRSVANIIQRGGTILKAGRCPEFTTERFRKIAHTNLLKAGIDGLVCIGGDGSFRGALSLWNEFSFPVVGIPGTIDNDIHSTDLTVGYDTALNTAVEAIDRIRDTAASHDRLFIVEVMGHMSGWLALNVGLAGGAEEVFIPEVGSDIDKVIKSIERGQARGKSSSILVTAEGQKPGRAYDLAEAIRKKSGLEAKVCVLGHIQRGGTPSAQDRILATRLGAAAVDVLLQGHCNIMVGTLNGSLVRVDLDKATQKKPFDALDLLDLLRILSH